MTERETEQATLVAFDVLYDVANQLLEDGYKLSSEERIGLRAKLRQLKRVAEWQRERLQEGEAEHG